MKRILVVLLCLACISSYAQRRRKKPAAKPAQTTQQPANQPAAVNPTTMSAVPTDTTKKVVAGPAKPFERPLDGYFKKANILSAKVTPYANLRESDAAFVKRIWREIDIREKMNAYLASPKQRLIDILLTAIDAGELTAYDPTNTTADPGGDSFLTPLAPGKARSRMADSSVVDQFDKNTGEKIGSKLQAGEFNADSVVKFRIKEDWVFDRQRSIFEPRIIGIAPLVKVKIGTNEDYQPAFWVYFQEARHILATKEVVNRNNDATGLSFDDALVKRLFTSYIVKESNDKDERIKDYANGIDKLYESERIKKNLMDWELNLWQY
ncbi:gliding motility protein GldN [Mucilaginibacter sp. BJC16-A38]|uniref:type IX secretion system ring protein PorN/GldN n=1 Tax=Mucilaginibacter phenanthrenivorans TaxID=1234842 RepID=UPI0021585499|nr:gliding motility protein GldN [Mucilaginibacter phenanthrenivorans]MCR8558673.1 gliding motility protein GldN [Mucilaginibacter phenanthrenivorans]